MSGHVRNYGAPLYSTLGPMQLDSVAEGFGCRGVRVEHREQFPAAFRDALGSDVPTVIHVPIKPSCPGE